MKNNGSGSYSLVGSVDGEPLSFSLEPGPNLLGRDPSSQIAIDIAEVSRFHAIVAVEPGRIVLTDLGSLNGTFVAGRRVHQSVLTPGVRLSFGPLELRLEKTASAAAAPPAPAEAAPELRALPPSFRPGARARTPGPEAGRRSGQALTTALDLPAPAEPEETGVPGLQEASGSEEHSSMSSPGQ